MYYVDRTGEQAGEKIQQSLYILAEKTFEICPNPGADQDCDEADEEVRNVEGQLTSLLNKAKKHLGINDIQYWHSAQGGKEIYQLQIPAKTKVPANWTRSSNTKVSADRRIASTRRQSLPQFHTVFSPPTPDDYPTCMSLPRCSAFPTRSHTYSRRRLGERYVSRPSLSNRPACIAAGLTMNSNTKDTTRLKQLELFDHCRRRGKRRMQPRRTSSDTCLSNLTRIEPNG
jgi:hypothetical protein